MHVLVATTQTQGLRPDDFCWTIEGELVRLPGLTCADPRCGCDRSWAGLASSRATTTCRVAELDIQREGLRAAFGDALWREGWLAGDDAWVDDFVDGHLEIASTFPVGAVLEVDHGEQVRCRQVAA